MDAREWDERYAVSELMWSATPNQFVEAETAALPAGRALDLAAGEGRNAIWLAQRGWVVTAVDFSQVALDKGKQMQPAGTTIDWVCADATTYSSDPTYDLTLVAYLQLPAAERRAALRHGFDAVRQGGTLLVVAHDSSNLTEGIGGPQYPEVLFTAQDVLDDLEGRQFAVERAERVARHVGEATAYDVLVRVERTG